MPCYSPLNAWRARGGGVTFIRGASLSGEPLKLPCGQCVGCRLERSRQWAMRCVHESKMHKDNCVLTLTYDDAHLPWHGTLVKRDLQLFMKRVRKHHGYVRFYACGEYGETTKRPHYHVVLFGLDFDDKRPYKKSKIGDDLYTSEKATALWGKGHVVVGSVTFESCAYVARYIVDKITGPAAKDWYDVVLPDGEIVRLQPEFTNMSRRPGIGRSYYAKYGAEVFTHDAIVMRGHEVRPPRYYDTLSEAIDPKRMELVKRNRRRKALVHAKDNSVDRRRVKERHANLLLSMWKRDVT